MTDPFECSSSYQVLEDAMFDKEYLKKIEAEKKGGRRQP